MFSCKSCCIVFILLVLLSDPNKFKVVCNKTVTVWEEAGRATGLLLHNCLRLSSARSPEKFLIIVKDCLSRRSLLAFDRLLGRDVIELADGVALVKYQKEQDDRALDISKDASRFDEGTENWKSQVSGKLTQLFRTHVLKIHLKGLNGSQFEGRRRHHKNNMLSQLLMFALIAAGVIVIPMGFQFLAILGGKALLLAKMALLMTAIQGLKKIATSNLNYGLYTSGSHGGPWHYDRKWPYEAEGHGDTYSYNYDTNQHYDILHPRHDLT